MTVVILFVLGIVLVLDGEDAVGLHGFFSLVGFLYAELFFVLEEHSFFNLMRSLINHS